MERKIVLLALALALLLLLSGCAATPRQRMFQGYRTYTSVVMLFVEARRAGAIKSDTLWAKIQRADAAAWAALKVYELTVENGLPSNAEWAAFNAAIDRFLDLYQRLDEPAAAAVPEILLAAEVLTWQRNRSF